jgi:hypothetical protein
MLLDGKKESKTSQPSTEDATLNLVNGKATWWLNNLQRPWLQA